MPSNRLAQILTIIVSVVLIVALTAASIRYWWQHRVTNFSSNLWLEYQERYMSNTTYKPLLPDFSYSGYHLQAKHLPTRSEAVEMPGDSTLQMDADFKAGLKTETVYRVTDYGAIGDGVTYSDKAVRKAVEAAVKGKGTGIGVVYFPPGRYRFGLKDNKYNIIKIMSDNIVLRGAGNGSSPTTSSILFLDNYIPGNKFLVYVKGRNAPGMKEQSLKSADGIHVVSSIPGETIKLQINDASDYYPGDCFRLRGRSHAWVDSWFGNIPLDPRWEIIARDGVTVDQPHCVVAVDKHANVLTLDSPIHTALSIKVGQTSLKLYRVRLVEEIGIENLRFESGWKAEKKPLCHLCNEKNTFGWQAIMFSLVKNSYIRDCVFDSWIGSVKLENTRANTVVDNTVTGKQGHHCFRTLRSYGNLFVDNTDKANTWHGPSFEMFDSGSVFLRHSMYPGQSLDPHGNLPTHTLIDSSTGVFVCTTYEYLYVQHL